jgi:hypothetical protein
MCKGLCVQMLIPKDEDVTMLQNYRIRSPSDAVSYTRQKKKKKIHSYATAKTPKLTKSYPIQHYLHMFCSKVENIDLHKSIFKNIFDSHIFVWCNYILLCKLYVWKLYLYVSCKVTLLIKTWNTKVIGISHIYHCGHNTNLKHCTKIWPWW